MAGPIDSKGSGSWQFAAYELPFLAVVLGLCWITLVAVLHPNLLTVTHSPTLTTFMATASLLVAAVTAYVALSEFLLYGLLASLCIGLAFLVLASGDVGVRLIPLLASSGRGLSWTPVGSAFEDTSAGILLAIAGLTTERVIAITRRSRFLVLGTAIIVSLVAVLTATVYRAGDAGLPRDTTTVLAGAGAVFFFFAAAVFWKASQTYSRPWFFWLAVSSALAGFAGLLHAAHQYPLTVVQPGDIIRLVFFTGILLALAAALGNNYRGLRWQARELQALHALSATRGIDDVMAAIRQIELVAHEALQADARVLLADRERVMGALSRRDEVNVAEDAGMWLMFLPIPDDTEGSELIGVPLRTPDHYLGTLVASRESGEEFSIYDLRLLRAYGAQASLLLERSILYEETAASAVLQERSRLAREIHDGLAQHLAFLKMRVAWLKRAPSGITSSQLNDVESVLETALIEARHAITTLRSQLAGGSPADAISRYAEEFGQVSGLPVRVQPQSSLPALNPKAQVELLRIVQEALNNVRKHARASDVTITLDVVDSGVETSICDDGTGFDLGHISQGHFGLDIMRERAESVAGRLSIISAHDGGTTVRVWMPSRDALPPHGSEDRNLEAAQG